MRRWLRLYINGWVEWLNKLQLQYDQYRCPHKFRPAYLSTTPGRVCGICEKVEPLTREEFFAYFGEVGGFNR